MLSEGVGVRVSNTSREKGNWNLPDLETVRYNIYIYNTNNKGQREGNII